MTAHDPDDWRYRAHALAFNALTRGLARHDRFVALNEREEITRDVLAALKDAGLLAPSVEVHIELGGAKLDEKLRDLLRAGSLTIRNAG